jgi:hypothetical protein
MYNHQPKAKLALNERRLNACTGVKCLGRRQLALNSFFTPDYREMASV